MKVMTREREARRWSRAELGRQSRLHPSRVGSIENERVRPYDIELERIAAALGWTGDPAALLEEVDHARPA